MLEPGKAAKTDKASIITDAIRIVTQLRAENGQLRQLNKFLEVFYFWPPVNLLVNQKLPIPLLARAALLCSTKKTLAQSLGNMWSGNVPEGRCFLRSLQHH